MRAVKLPTTSAAAALLAAAPFRARAADGEGREGLLTGLGRSLLVGDVTDLRSGTVGASMGLAC